MKVDHSLTPGGIPLNSLPPTVQTFLENLNLTGDTIVVAVSGGPDSVALVRALALLPASGRIVLAHLNHQLRGAESDQDQAFVVDLCQQLAAATPDRFVGRWHAIPVAARAAERKEGIETTARALRYEWLTTVAQEVGACWVATGHTADDQAETVLHHLLRGTGIKGLRGIPDHRPLAPGIEVIRPLLQVSRQEVLSFLAELEQPFRQDSSNTHLRFLRNRLRHELLPLLAERYNPAIVPALCRLAEQAGALYQQEEEQARELLTAAELPRAGALLIFDQRRLQSASRHQVRGLFRLVWEREGWPLLGMGFREWDRLAAVALGKTPATDLPGRVHARRRGQVMQLFRFAIKE
jgi:tRNA(Ile)-lysidine synthase